VARRELVKVPQAPQAMTISLVVVMVAEEALPLLVGQPQGLEAMEDSQAGVRVVVVVLILELAEHLEWAAVDV
jgi:hypothetical protein